MLLHGFIDAHHPHLIWMAWSESPFAGSDFLSFFGLFLSFVCWFFSPLYMSYITGPCPTRAEGESRAISRAATGTPRVFTGTRVIEDRTRPWHKLGSEALPMDCFPAFCAVPVCSGIESVAKVN